MALGEFNEFRKSPFSTNTTDEFKDSLVHVFYDDKNLIKGVEFLSGSSFLISGEDIFNLSARSALDFIKKCGCEVRMTDVGFNVDNIRLRFYAPEIFECDGAKIKSIYVEL